MGTELYERLGVEKTASFDEIREAYRMLSKRYHPDNQETGDEEKFRSIAEAHDVLTDPDRRGKYDTIGIYGESEEDKTTVAAYGMIQNLVVQFYLSSPAFADLKNSVRDQIDNECFNLASAVGRHKTAVRNLERGLDAVTSKLKGKPEIMGALEVGLKAHLGKAKSELAQAERACMAPELARKMWSEVRFEGGDKASNAMPRMGKAWGDIETDHMAKYLRGMRQG